MSNESGESENTGDYSGRCDNHDSGDVVVKEGQKGELKQFITPAVEVKVEDGQVTAHQDESMARSQHGLIRALIFFYGNRVTKGYENI